MQTLSRRRFFTQALGLALFSALAFSQFDFTRADVAANQKPATDLPVPKGETPVNAETDPVAQVLGYHPDVKDTDFKKYPQRKLFKAKNQFCKSCVHFTSSNAGWGKCEIITGGVVNAHGWCGSYSKRE